MKKKDKAKKKEDMPEFEFKQFTPEEDKIYEDAVNAFREAIGAGKSLKDAYASYSVEDKELEALIQADFLKIMIAEIHFGKGKTITETARELSVSTDLIDDTRKRMLQEAGVTAANEFGREYGDIIPKKTDD